VEAWARGDADSKAVTAGKTLCFGLNVPGGVGHFKVLEAIRDSGGCAISMPEAEMERALSSVWREKHWWICPEGAACLAALGPLAAQGAVKPGERVVVVNTGSLEKYLPELRHLL